MYRWFAKLASPQNKAKPPQELCCITAAQRAMARHFAQRLSDPMGGYFVIWRSGMRTPREIRVSLSIPNAQQTDWLGNGF
jgi:hypothetical protein